jgi:hypothetical protein
VILHGSGFDAAPQNNTALFGDRTGRVVGASATQLTVEVPSIELSEGQSTNVGVRVIVGRAATGIVDVQLYREPAATAAAEPPAESEPDASVGSVAAEASPAPSPAADAATTAEGPRPAASAKPRPVKATPAPVTMPPATLPPAPPVGPPPAPPAQRRFVLERTAVESNKRASGGGVAGFEAEGVALKRAPDVLGRVEFDVQPAQVKPGDRFTVQVFLINDGKKDIKLKDMFVATSINGRLVSGPGALRTKEVGPKDRQVIASFSDTWRDTIATWAMDVTVTSDRGDVYKNQVIWK